MTRSKDLVRLDHIAQTIFDKKGFNILALDVRKVSSLTEYYVIAEGNVQRHIAALANAVVDQQTSESHPPFRVEGIKGGDWVVLDFGHIIVHLFSPDLREHYALEKLWKDAEIVDLSINTLKEN